MNKRMRDLLSEIESKNKKARELLEGGDDREAVKSLIAEIKELSEEYELEKSLFESEQQKVDPKKGEPAVAGKEKAASGFTIIAKMINKQRLSETEKALVYGDDGEGEPTANDENLLVPEDVQTEINELRRSYVSAKELVTIIPTRSLSGSMVFESGSPSGLTDFDDGDDVPEGNEPSFVSKSWAIKLKGKLIRIGRLLLGSEKAGLMAYLNKWFVRNAVVSENADIFAQLKAGKTAKNLANWKALKKSINKDLDPDSLIDGVIVTNQSGFDALDSAVDGQGRPILTPDPTNSSKKMLSGLPIKIFSDAQLANEGGKAPVFYGDTKSGIFFIEKTSLEFAVSEHYFFGKNCNALRVVEGYDVMQADADTYCYGLLTIPA